MSLLWTALIAVFVFIEKLLPYGQLASRVSGLALVLAGSALPLAA